MTGLAPSAEPGDDAGLRRAPEPSGMPRWVKVFLTIAVVLVLAFIVSRLAGIEHGPGLHGPPQGGSPTHTAPVEPQGEQSYP